MDRAGDTRDAVSSHDVTVTPLTPVIGAEISGVDLRERLTPELRDEFHRLLLRYRVLFWRDQQMSTEQQITFAEAFGPILVFSGVAPPDPAHPGVHEVHGSTVGWHIDASSALAPPVATVLRALDIPPRGGDTIWASGVAAYEGLPDQLKTQLEGRYATHRAPEADHPIVSHPLVRTHPETGERHLYLNLAPWVEALILGVSAHESAALVERLRQEYLRPEYQVRFQWSPGAIAMWDNRVVQHTGTQDYSDFPRHMKRICLASFHESCSLNSGAMRG
ncbi:MAG: TauD/TfdA dioxygenase family protein [Pseudonocardiaceae bacterium]